ncbi:MAG: hypothetical protein OXD34_03085 [bacterium]|nr:hypothetical protein [bacterium]
MPDFDCFERLIRQTMVVEDDEIDQLVRDMEAIRRENRPQLFKGRSFVYLDQWVGRARQALVSEFGADARFSTTNLNLKGSDLAVIGTDIEIELKTGQVTDANIGIEPMSWAFGDEDESVLSDIMSESMYERRAMAYRGDYSGIRASQERTMYRLYAYLHERLEEGQEAPPRLAHYARAVARGITKKKDIEPLFGRDERDWKVPWIFHADWRCGWIPRTNPFDLEEDIIVDRIWKGPVGRSSIPRAQARVRGRSSDRTAKFYPNYKNSFLAKNSPSKVEAKHWVKTACFHVWIDK